MGCAQSKPEVYRVAPAPPEGSSAPGLERRSTGRIYADALKTGEGASQEKEYDAYLSFEATAASLAAEVRSSLEGYQLPAPASGLKEKLATLRASRRVVIFLTPKYFSDAGCCAEFCEAVAAGIEVLPVCVEGSTWSGMPFPALTDVPEKMETPVGTKAPRDAAGAVFGHTIAIEHKAAYVSQSFTSGTLLGPNWLRGPRSFLLYRTLFFLHAIRARVSLSIYLSTARTRRQAN